MKRLNLKYEELLPSDNLRVSTDDGRVVKESIRTLIKNHPDLLIKHLWKDKSVRIKRASYALLLVQLQKKFPELAKEVVERKIHKLRFKRLESLRKLLN